MINTDLHKAAIAAGADVAPAYECNGKMEPQTYTVTLDQLEIIVRSVMRKADHYRVLPGQEEAFQKHCLTPSKWDSSQKDRVKIIDGMAVSIDTQSED